MWSRDEPIDSNHHLSSPKCAKSRRISASSWRWWSIKSTTMTMMSCTRVFSLFIFWWVHRASKTFLLQLLIAWILQSLEEVIVVCLMLLARCLTTAMTQQEDVNKRGKRFIRMNEHWEIEKSCKDSNFPQSRRFLFLMINDVIFKFPVASNHANAIWES